ncbi:hypothetical protein HG535_0D02910 [Zygotorulaspora mrakii]|uniref:AP complex subunit beta n=1 Tax=Zygotorulaspora mrakii TaxID=42260 RepID=A0A7H9B264_ZYGMR|nr:uncharacterized protein HG535_0D02910 [Zygotorulaspora mrakii]QLG72583.1 hypothetical protein HG535_0D02910 [Zygotorulaspora mrakii]
MAPLNKKIQKFLKDSIRVAPKISKKGELAELRNGLVSPYPQTRKDAIKKTIQQMTLGKDVSSLFPDVLKNIATNDVEQKKLVYLYVMNYAESHPELCILAVNTFVTDAQDPNPLIRCMSIRTMSMVRVDKILEYVEIPLRRTLQDDNPYVRKTAVICVAKLFQLNQELCIELGVLEDLVSALDDSNPMVVANATAALTEIHGVDPSVVSLPKLINSHVSQFLLALNECTEWARITILGALADYSAKDSLEAQDIIDRVSAHLQHVNPAVVLATIKVIIRNLPQIQQQNFKAISLKLSSALVSIMSTPPEMQYVALKNIRIILEKYPELLVKELRIFYVKFNDPLYVKLEKIDIMVRLVDATNLKQCNLLLTELKEYAMEFEPEFVSKSIQGITQLAIKYSGEKFVSKALDDLLELVDRTENLKDDCCIAMCDLLRHCPTNEKIASDICALLNSWAVPESSLISDAAKCNYIWLMGHYPEKFTDLEGKLDQMIENFVQEECMTQASILMTVVRLHTQLPGSTLQNVLEMATTSVNEIDIRDMAMIYWRCLSMPNSDTLVDQLCKSVAPIFENALDNFSTETLEKLLNELSTISSIYFRPQSVRAKRYVLRQNIVRGKRMDELKDMAKNEIAKNMNDDVLLDFGDDEPKTSSSGNVSSNLLDDLDDIFGFNSTGATTSSETKDMQSSTNKMNTSTTNTQDLLNLF